MYTYIYPSNYVFISICSHWELTKRGMYHEISVVFMTFYFKTCSKIDWNELQLFSSSDNNRSSIRRYFWINEPQINLVHRMGYRKKCYERQEAVDTHSKNCQRVDDVYRPGDRTRDRNLWDACPVIKAIPEVFVNTRSRILSRDNWDWWVENVDTDRTEYGALYNGTYDAFMAGF